LRKRNLLNNKALKQIPRIISKQYWTGTIIFLK
jgi:hypothetical protein